MNLLSHKYLFAGCLLIAGTLSAWGQSAPSLAIRIDDLGAFHSVNEACIETYQSGIARSVEVMPVAAWYPEAVRLLKENPGLDAGLHLVITSEWENVKWRPLTHCPSLTDENGYFYPMMGPNPAYPGQSVMENKWDIKEVEQEFRAQIEMALRNIPQLSHMTGHMLSTGFTKEVNELVIRLAKEYNLPSIDRMDSPQDYQFTYIGYDGPNRTSAEKEESFICSLNKLEAVYTIVQEEQSHFFLGFTEYHSRYDQLTTEDFQNFVWNRKTQERWKGYTPLNRHAELTEPDMSHVTTSQEMTEKSKEYFEKIVELTKKEGITLALISGPYLLEERDQEVYNSIGQLAEKDGLLFWNTNTPAHYREMGLDFSTDYADHAHLNEAGGAKYTAYLGKWLSQNYSFPDRRGQKGYESWENQLMKSGE